MNTPGAPTGDSGSAPGEAESEPSGFAVDVLAVVATLGPGEIATYGEIAAEAGRPGAARAVGTALRRFGDRVPWWRVVAANGRLVPGAEQRHGALLAEEGVAVRDGRVVPVAPGQLGP